MKRLFSAILLILITYRPAVATEGMWIPSMLNSMIQDDMQALGMRISAEDLYQINASCIRDAVVHFNGGCSSVLVSEKGLLLTNHHCGYGRIQAHSSLEHNYLEDGFWAMTLAEELPNPNMEASIIKEIRDVSEAMFEGMPENTSEADRMKWIKERSADLAAEASKSTGYRAYIKPFYYGNQFLMFLEEVFTDVRLVGAPPSSIGKFGYDTDNWVWPRHTGDFSVFRIYANPDNKPADYSVDNVPYKPNHFLPVSLGGVEEHDFTLVYGFPGRTDNYITSHEVTQILEQINPMRLDMRRASLGVIDAAMRADQLVKIQYAAKQSRISNAYKKWIGQSKGLTRHHAIDRKDSLEAVFQSRVEARPDWTAAYGTLLSDLSAVQDAMIQPTMSREYFIEFFYMGPEILRFAEGFSELETISRNAEVSDDSIAHWIDKKLSTLGFFKNYNAQVDEAIMQAQIGYFVEGQPSFDFVGGIVKGKTPESLQDFVRALYGQTVFADEAKLRAFLTRYKRSHWKKLAADPAYAFSTRVYDHFFTHTRPALTTFAPRQDSLMREWMQALMTVIPEKTYYPDANGTLRITFGRVEGYIPFDGAEYAYYTTLEGIMEKEDATNPEFNVPARLKDLYERKEYGRYAHSTGEMRVAFVASNHTSGGNSGSPVIGANGSLIGLNFDRTWESTMSDIMFNPTICRNITVDIRYVLFIMDKYAGAGHLVDEMQLVR